MKILFVGHLNEKGRTWQRLEVIKELGHKVVALTTEDTDRSMDYKPGLLYRILWKLGYQPDEVNVNHKILSTISKHDFDVLWIEKGNTIKPAVLRYISHNHPGIKIASYSEDDMYRRANRTWRYTHGLKYYDVVFTTKSYNANDNELPSLGAGRVEFVDKSYDRNLHRPVDISDDDAGKFGADVGFIGTYEHERAESIAYLAQHGVKVRLFGSGDWSKLDTSNDNIMFEGKGVYGDDYIKAICATKINLSFLRKANRDLQTDRSMEIPACQAFMLAERTVEHLRLFSEGKEAEYFSTNEELLEKVRYYLEHDQERQSIARNARQRCLDSGYSHHERLREMLACLK